ncbi:MAG: FKBP-type peptidyl-prolyl cis-trans isomerase [Bacteroidales bacterium]|nr:FKBP-type peptidyl-prolyl cis-trans isomerase [Bacteroidales bacterium]MBK7627543.1 FKBP-type peptidyl-prolyl cis-trans isomerase [Bacteroidales bacterium]
MQKILIFSYFILFILSSCRNASEKPVVDNKPGTDEMAELNRYFVQKDRERIQNYAERKGLNLIESPTGLWYQIIKQGDGTGYSDNDRIVFEYECSLLDGTKCYSSQTLGPKDIVLGRSSLEPGLNEGLRMLKPGGEAIFILPPFLAFGLPGDGKMIPSRAVIVYNVNILQPE